MKTHSGAKKRFIKLKSGLIKMSGQGRRHYMGHKSPKTKRTLRKGRYVCAADRKHLASLLSVL
jgi:large subunit ribosomal protein L35